MQAALYTPTQRTDSSWDKQADREARRDLARKLRARKWALTVYGATLYELRTGEKPRLATVRVRHATKALFVDADSILS